MEVGGKFIDGNFSGFSWLTWFLGKWKVGFLPFRLKCLNMTLLTQFLFQSLNPFPSPLSMQKLSISFQCFTVSKYCLSSNPPRAFVPSKNSLFLLHLTEKEKNFFVLERKFSWFCAFSWVFQFLPHFHDSHKN